MLDNNNNKKEHQEAFKDLQKNFKSSPEELYLKKLNFSMMFLELFDLRKVYYILLHINNIQRMKNVDNQLYSLYKENAQMIERNIR